MNYNAIIQKTATITLLIIALTMCLTTGAATALSTYMASAPPIQQSASNPPAIQAAPAQIWTDKADYHPGELVTIYGSGFLANTPVSFVVTKLKDNTTTTWSADSDSQGNLTTTYQIDAEGAPLYNIEATDGTNMAKTTFTDSKVTQTIPVGLSPYGVAYDSGRHCIYVANSRANSVSVISDSTNAVIATIFVGLSPAGVAYDFGTNCVYVANYDSTSVSVISDSTNGVIATIPVGGGFWPAGVAYDFGANCIYVANSAANSVSVISDNTNGVIATIPVGNFPDGVAYNSGRHCIYVANSADYSVSVISDSTNAVIATILVGLCPAGVAYDSGTHCIYVANSADNSVSVISDSTNAVIATIPVGSSPAGVAYNSGTHCIYVADYYGNSVSVISDSTNAVIATIPVGSSPAGVAYDFGANCIYVANNGGASVSVISDSDAPTIKFMISGMDADTSGSIVNIGGTDYTYAQLSAGVTITSWTEGSTHAITATSPVGVSGGTKQYVFSSWTNGNGLTSASGTFTTPSSDTTVTLTYKTQYSVTPYYTVNGGGSPTVTNAVHYTSNGVSSTATPTLGDSGGNAIWADADTSITYTSPIYGTLGQRWIISNSDSTTHTVLASVASSQTVTAAYTLQTATSIQISTPIATAGTAFPITVTVKDQAGATMTSYTGTIHFTSNDIRATLPADYTFQASDQGVKTFTCKLIRAGSTPLTATDTTINSITGSASTTVNPDSLVFIEVGVSAPTLTAGNPVTFSNQGYDQYGNSLDEQPVTYTVNDQTVVGNSVIETVYGTYTVSVTANGVTIIPATFTVNPAALLRINIHVSSATVVAGNSVELSARGYDVYGNDLGPQTLTYMVNGGAVTGNSVTETAAGDYIVSATKLGVEVVSASFHVNPASLATITISLSSTSVTAGTPIAITATGTDQYNNTLGPQTVTFTVNGTPIEGSTVTETKPGDYTVSTTNNVTITPATFHVNHAGADHLIVTSSGSNIVAGGNSQYAISAVDQYGNMWDVSNQTVLGINCPSGSHSWANNIVTVTKAGSWTVTASYAGLTGTAKLTVTHTAVNTITVTPTATTNPAGTPVTYATAAQDIYGNSWDITAQTSWSADNAAGGSWSNSTYTALKAGNWTITCTYATKSAAATLTVTPAPLDHFNVTAPASAIQQTAFSVTVTALDAYGNTLTDFTGTVTLSSSTGSINPSTSGNFTNGVWTGTVTLSSQGSQTITASSNSKTGTSQAITVTAQVTPTPTLNPTVTPTPSPSPSPTPTPTTTPSSTTVIATDTTTQKTYTITVNGNVTAQQITNMTITPNQTNGTAIAFTLTGESGTNGFCNLTIPKAAIPYGTNPTIYIDGAPATNQDYTQDADNYYVWFTTHFSTHQVTIQFAKTTEQSTALWVYLASISAIALISLLIVALFIRKRKK
jgi:YVTN family beta-propeller protein